MFTKENLDTIPYFDDRVFVNCLDSIAISRSKIYNKLTTLKTCKSAGPDNLFPRVLKELATELCVPLSKIFSKSLDEGKLPEVWKRANITPIYKKGDRASPSNYHPVSLTSIVSKVLESIVRESMLDHLFNNNLITNHQHGFLPCRSCTTQLLMAIED